MEAFTVLSAPRYRELCSGARVHEELSVMHATAAVIVDGSTGAGGAGSGPGSAAFSTLPCVVIAVTDTAHVAALSPLCDIILTEDEFDIHHPALHASIAANPLAAVSLALHLRQSESRSTAHGLLTESTLYSLLQAGPEFRSWLEQRGPSTAADPSRESPVRAERLDGELHLTLNRPHRHNAFSRAMRDELSAMLEMAADDPTVTAISIDGEGPSFCSGGDLSEFGTFASPVASHLTRLTRSPARLLAGLAAKTSVQLHGACYGAGIELPAFAGRVTAHPDARICLPELGLGLIPGAGGTVSMPRRIGRHRTALLALSQSVVNASTALAWGLIDAIEG